MGTFIWQDQYGIGDVTIDGQHRRLFDLANQLVEAATSDEITRLFMLFYQHVREHFQVEETMMKQHRYPDYAKHVEAHNLMLDKLIEISKSVQSGQWTRAEIQTFADNWLRAHIMEVDMSFGKFLRQRRQA